MPVAGCATMKSERRSLTMRCSKFWANNDGGLWRWRHQPEIPAGACDNCPEQDDKKEADNASNDNKDRRSACTGHKV